MPIETAENPCPNCGSRSYMWGILESNGGVWFKEDRKFSFWGEGLRARLCTTCGNIQVFLRAAVEDSIYQGDIEEKRKREG